MNQRDADDVVAALARGTKRKAARSARGWLKRAADADAQLGPELAAYWCGSASHSVAESYAAGDVEIVVAGDASTARRHTK
jgi:hypothetical protein